GAKRAQVVAPLDDNHALLHPLAASDMKQAVYGDPRTSDGSARPRSWYTSGLRTLIQPARQVPPSPISSSSAASVWTTGEVEPLTNSRFVTIKARHSERPIALKPGASTRRHTLVPRPSRRK